MIVLCSPLKSAANETIPVYETCLTVSGVPIQIKLSSNKKFLECLIFCVLLFLALICVDFTSQWLFVGLCNSSRRKRKPATAWTSQQQSALIDKLSSQRVPLWGRSSSACDEQWKSLDCPLSQRLRVRGIQRDFCLLQSSPWVFDLDQRDVLSRKQSRTGLLFFTLVLENYGWFTKGIWSWALPCARCKLANVWFFAHLYLTCRNFFFCFFIGTRPQLKPKKSTSYLLSVVRFLCFLEMFSCESLTADADRLAISVSSDLECTLSVPLFLAIVFDKRERN